MLIHERCGIKRFAAKKKGYRADGRTTQRSRGLMKTGKECALPRTRRRIFNEAKTAGIKREISHGRARKSACETYSWWHVIPLIPGATRSARATLQGRAGSRLPTPPRDVLRPRCRPRDQGTAATRRARARPSVCSVRLGISPVALTTPESTRTRPTNRLGRTALTASPTRASRSSSARRRTDRRTR